MLSAFSAGIVGLGDRLGRTDRSIVERLIDDEGRLVTSATPMALCPESFFDAEDAGVITWADAHDGDHRYLLALHLDDSTEPLAGSLDLDGEYLVHEWRSGTSNLATSIEVELTPRDWALYVVCPTHGPEGARWAVVGDTRRYATRGGSGRDASPSDATRWLEIDG